MTKDENKEMVSLQYFLFPMNYSTLAPSLSKGLIFMSAQDRRQIRDLLIENDYERLIGTIGWDGSPSSFVSNLAGLLNSRLNASEFTQILKKIVKLAIEYETSDKIKSQLEEIIIE